MKIKNLSLYSQDLEKQISFYRDTLSIPILEKDDNYVSFKIGHSTLTFRYSKQKAIYHYCFLIPSNQLSNAIHYLSEKVDLIAVDGSTKVPQNESWNADSVYFYDGEGNIIEFIARYDLHNEVSAPFTPSQIIGINEIGFPTEDVAQTNQTLNQIIGTEFWLGDKKRFGTNGTQNGLFLLVNPLIKDIWFPTDLPITKDPFEAIVTYNNNDFNITYNKKGWNAKPKHPTL